jgi:hydrogenase/urease accessory protein HupE
MRLLSRKNICRVILLLILLPSSAFGHNPMTSWAIARFSPDRMELEVEMSAESAWALLGEPATTPPDVASAIPRLKALGPSLYKVSAGGVELSPVRTDVELREEDGVAFLLTYAPPAAGPLRFDAAFLRKLSGDHRSTLTFKDEADRVLRTELLTTNSATVDTPFPPGAGTSPAAPQATTSFRAFLKLGVEHILTGYDHLLFLCGLLVVCRRFKIMAAIVTCFTLAHSITLALAALDLVNLPGRIVEPLIAASIVFVGLENLLRRDEPKWRWALTFAFGLIHGFGFAGVLKQIGLGSSGRAFIVPLFSFNLGVELGQIAVTAILLPLLWRLRRLHGFERYGVQAISAAVALIGAYWLVQRIFF